MYKQIFNKSDGTPKLIESIVDIDRGEDYFDYDDSEYTDIQPPDGLYQPIHFNGKEWIGTLYEEWLSNQPTEETTEIIVDEKDELIADLSLQLLEQQNHMENLQSDIADLTLQILGGTENA